MDTPIPLTCHSVPRYAQARSTFLLRTAAWNSICFRLDSRRCNSTLRTTSSHEGNAPVTRCCVHTGRPIKIFLNIRHISNFEAVWSHEPVLPPWRYHNWYLMFKIKIGSRKALVSQSHITIGPLTNCERILRSVHYGVYSALELAAESG